MRRRGSLYITGQTEDGQLTVGGCFKLLDTHGVPISLVVQELKSQDLVMDWVDFCVGALKAEWTLGKAFTVLREAVGDNYSPQWRIEWETKMVHWCRERARTHGS